VGDGGGIFLGGNGIFMGVLNNGIFAGLLHHSRPTDSVVSSLTINGCRFVANTAVGTSSSSGGAVSAFGAVSARVTNSELSANIAAGRAGAIGASCDSWSNAACKKDPTVRPQLEIVNCTLTSNDADEGGGLVARARWACGVLVFAYQEPRAVSVGRAHNCDANRAHHLASSAVSDVMIVDTKLLRNTGHTAGGGAILEDRTLAVLSGSNLIAYNQILGPAKFDSKNVSIMASAVYAGGLRC
jgi:hypothetical protein